MAYRTVCGAVGVLIGLFVTVAGPGAAWAQSQAGGLPAVSARVATLEGVAATLQAAVASLLTQITGLQAQVTGLKTQVTGLETANTDLQNALTSETAARTVSDAALQASIVLEGQRRLTADTELRNLIASAKGPAFSSFNRKADLVNGAGATVGTLGPMPPGNYLVVAKAAVQNFKNDAGWFCNLLRADGAPIDGTFASTESRGIGEIVSLSETNLTNVAVTTLTVEGSLKMVCGTHNGAAGSTVFDIAIAAVQVGAATIGCPDLSFLCPGE
jgi:hypothetical protein